MEKHEEPIQTSNGQSEKIQDIKTMNSTTIVKENHENTLTPKDVNTRTTEPRNRVKNKNTEVNGHMTISTKISTDQLICKTPRESPNSSVRDIKALKDRASSHDQAIFYLGTLQFILGFFMVVFGVFTIVYKASLSQLGGGIWAGLLSMATGVSGMLAAANSLCPFRSTAQRVTHTVFLALSLISLAVAQLIVVIAGTGLARDVNSAGNGTESYEAQLTVTKTPIPILENYRLLFSIALIVAASLECIFAAISAYKSSRKLCSCFKSEEEFYQDNLNMNRSHAIVSSWLGKHSDISGSPQPIYVVATGPPSTLGKRSRLSSGRPIPIYAFPPQPMIQPQIMTYPLIPAPLDVMASPMLPPTSRRRLTKVTKKYKSKSKSRSKEPTPRKSKSKSRSKSKSKEPPQMTEADAVRTYTGLDRTIAEEFIDICEMRNASSSESTTCTNSSTCQSNSGKGSRCQSPCECPQGCHSNQSFIDICEMRNASSSESTTCTNSSTCQSNSGKGSRCQSPCECPQGCHSNQSEANSQDCLLTAKKL